MLVEYGTTGAYDSVYEYGVQRTTMYQNGQVYSYEYDGRGSVSELVNAIGETQIKYSYGAYGETVSTVIGWNNPVTNPYRYNAERIDDVAGVPAFQYLRARYLNPYTATFLTQDTYLGNLIIPLSQNRYTYTHNNPVNYADPSGHGVLAALGLGALIGAALSGVASVFNQLNTTGEVDAGTVLKDALIGGATTVAALGTGLAVAAGVTTLVGAATITGAISLTATQSIGLGILSNVAGGMAARYTSSVLNNTFSPEKEQSNTLAEVLNPTAVAFDGTLGAFTGGLTHYATGGIYGTPTSAERSAAKANSAQTSTSCEKAQELIKQGSQGIDDSAGVVDDAVGNSGNVAQSLDDISQSADDATRAVHGNQNIDDNSLASIIRDGKISADDIRTNPTAFSGKTAEEIADELVDSGYDVTVRTSTRSRSGAQIIEIDNPGNGKNISQVQVSPGGGRHGSLPYVKISTTDQGIIKIIDGAESEYITDGLEKAILIFTGGKAN